MEEVLLASAVRKQPVRVPSRIARKSCLGRANPLTLGRRGVQISEKWLHFTVLKDFQPRDSKIVNNNNIALV